MPEHQEPYDPFGGQKTVLETCSLRWVCLSLGLQGREGLGCRQGMLFKTKKETLALKGEEGKQLPVASGGFLEGGAFSVPFGQLRPGPSL